MMRDVGLFVTCLVDVFRPSVGFAAVQLLENAGCTVTVPATQTCCGQPAYNSGDRTAASVLAQQHIALFEPFDYVVIPSGSCGGMIKRHYPLLFTDDPAWKARAESLSAKTFELTTFLVDVLGVSTVNAAYPHAVTYHDSCSGLRELHIKAQPRQLLAMAHSAQLTELADTEACCGFGGSFCLKYAAIADHIVHEKVAHIQATGADTVIGGDVGCLLHIERALQRAGLPITVQHIAEVLAGQPESR